ncbi:hypothetical protein [Rubripirellula lacrimiformis]|nr:hypothetical protein [Rubripirellula lacrimiformis]
MKTVEPALPRLRGLVRDTFDDLLIRRHSDDAFAWMDEGESAWWMWTQLRHRAKDDFHGEPMLVYRRVKQQDFIVVCEEAIVVFKKLRNKTNRDGTTELVTSNCRTKQNMDWWGQRAIDEVPDLPRVIVGYEFRHELTEMHCYLGLPRGSNATLQWHREIDSPQGFEDGFTEERTFEEQPTEDFGFEIEELDDSKSERFG